MRGEGIGSYKQGMFHSRIVSTRQRVDLRLGMGIAIVVEAAAFYTYIPNSTSGSLPVLQIHAAKYEPSHPSIQCPCNRGPFGPSLCSLNNFLFFLLGVTPLLFISKTYETYFKR